MCKLKRDQGWGLGTSREDRWGLLQPGEEISIVNGGEVRWIDAWCADGPQWLHGGPSFQIGKGVVVREGGQ